MIKGTRWIKGQEFIICGRAFTKDSARTEKQSLLKEWSQVRIIKLNDNDYALYVHGYMGELN